MKTIKNLFVLSVIMATMTACPEPQLDVEQHKAWLLKEWQMRWVKENDVMIYDWSHFTLDLSNIYSYTTTNTLNELVFENRDGWWFGSYHELQRNDGILMRITSIGEDNLELSFTIGSQRKTNYQEMHYVFRFMPK